MITADPTPKLRVLHILASSASGGVPSALLRLMRRSSFERVVICPRDDEANHDAVSAEALAIYDIPIRRLSFSTFWAVLRVIQSTAPDVIHTHGKGAGLYGRLAAWFSSVPVIHTYHGFHNKYPWPLGHAYLALERFLGRFAARAIAVSASEGRKILAERLVQPTQLVLQPNPIELPREACRLELRLGPEFNVVSLSRVSPQKDLMTLLRVAKRLGDSYRFHILGGVNTDDQAYAAEIHAMQKAMNVQNVIFYGDVPFGAALLPRFDAFLSTALWEGLPTAIVEAFLAGLPVVGTDCTGNVDLLHHGDTGLLCPCGDDASLAASLDTLLRNPALRKKIADRARAAALETYDVDHAVRNLDRLYAEVAPQRPGR